MEAASLQADIEGNIISVVKFFPLSFFFLRFLLFFIPSLPFFFSFSISFSLSYFSLLFLKSRLS